MRVDVAPQSLQALPGIAQPISITVTNTGDVIGGYLIRVLGADPDWVELDAATISVFPQSSGSTVLRLTVPEGLSAGVRRIGVQVQELTPPESVTVEEIDVEVPAAAAMLLNLDASSVTGGSRASTSLQAANTGNTTLSGRLVAIDPEDQVAFDFQPQRLKLAPGEQAPVDLRMKARRPWFGNPLVRPYQIGFEQSDAFAVWEDTTRRDETVVIPPGSSLDATTVMAPIDPAPIDPAPIDPAPIDRAAPAPAAVPAPFAPVAVVEPAPFALPPAAHGVFVQKPRFSRLLVSLLSLAAAVTVFGLVITLVLSQVVSQSAADRQLALAVAAARSSAGGTGTASIGGTVTLLTSGAGVGDVAVQLFGASDTATAVATTRTADDGTYTLPGLAAGNYKVAFFGAGFAELWYPAALTDADAASITLAPGKAQGNVDVQLGGLPASIAGTLVGDDVSNAKVQLTLPIGASSVVPTTPTPDDPTGGAPIVRTVPVGADGTFTIDQIPSPGVYDLVASKPGYATQIQPIDLSGGESRTGVQIMLQKGNGLISGQVVGQSGPIGGATISATSGTTTVRTISVTQGAVGSFVLRNLPSPATFTVVVSSPGYASSTLTLTLANGQQLSGVNVVLGTAAGSLAGVVTLSPGGAPAPGVSVTVSNGALTSQTVTQSNQANATPGAWSVGGLSIPSTYTVTFSRADLASQTLSVSLDAFGNVTADSQGSAPSASQVNVSMRSATATLQGVVFQDADTSLQSGCNPDSAIPPGAPMQGEATITLTSGASSYTTTSASIPDAAGRNFVLAGLTPGTYTISVTKPGRAPTTITTTLAAGDIAICDVAIAAPASVTGRVVSRSGDQSVPYGGATMVLYVSSQYPTTSKATAPTDAEGRYVFTGVDAPASYVLEVRSANGVLGSTTFSLTPSETLALPDIVVTP